LKKITPPIQIRHSIHQSHRIPVRCRSSRDTRTHMHAHTHVHTLTQTLLRTHSHTHTHTNTHTHTHTHTLTHRRFFRTHSYIYTLIDNNHIQTLAFSPKHTHTHKYVKHTHTHYTWDVAGGDEGDREI